MYVQRPIFWNRGILLQPQHFQLLDRTCQGLLAPYQKYQEPHFWGVGSLAMSKSALSSRTFGVTEGEFLFPDGTFVSLGDNGPIDSRAFQEAWMEGGKQFTVYLGLRNWCESGENVRRRLPRPLPGW